MRLTNREPAQGSLTDTMSPKNIIQSMISAVRGMSSATELHFEWRDLPLNKDTRIFLTSTRTAFDKSLRKLALQAQISKFKELLAITNFAYIDELDFHFDYRTRALENMRQNGGESKGDPDAVELLDTIMPFIEHRKSYLRTLVLSSTSLVDLSEFFKQLPSLPLLRHFGASIYFDKEHLSDPSGLLHLLKTSSWSLLHVRIRPNCPEVPRYNRALSFQQKRADWERINNSLLVDSNCLAGLESLQIPFLSVQKTLPLLARSYDTLTSLCLTDTFLSLEQVISVINVFSRRAFELRHLHLEVLDLNLKLLQTLSSRLPRLSSLVIVYKSQIFCDLVREIPLRGLLLLTFYLGNFRSTTHRSIRGCSD